MSELKNSLSAYLARVKAGESVLVLDRGIPVARLEPARDVPDDARLARLERAGIVRRGSGKLERILEEPPPSVRGRTAAVDAVLDERRQGR